MRIDQWRCVACGNCLAVCPVGAIHIDPGVGRAVINEDACVECYNCFRGMSKEHLFPPMVRAIRRVAKAFRFRFDPEPDICPTDAIVPTELGWPRVVRRAFSDPVVEHAATGIHGRGTEEVKTNDVTHRVGEGETGFVVEFGRPGVGVRFHEIQRMTRALAELGVEFEKKNPVTSMMSDPKRGEIREDVLNEKILSAIVEFKTTLERVPELLGRIEEVAEGLSTVVALGVSTRCDSAGQSRLPDLLAGEGYTAFRGKTNLGLGRTPPAGSVDPRGGSAS
ncbi:MAG: 4Fe-4S binding protein [Candidatus Rokubacteria bacterium]|nr:4Fe-4S binding protein [Candidatus Rokubacteria bacterium]